MRSSIASIDPSLTGETPHMVFTLGLKNPVLPAAVRPLKKSSVPKNFIDSINLN